MTRRHKSQSKRALAYRGIQTFTQQYRPDQLTFAANDHEPRQEWSVYAHDCWDCHEEVRPMEPCYMARVNDRRRWWHLPCLPDAMAP